MALKPSPLGPRAVGPPYFARRVPRAWRPYFDAVQALGPSLYWRLNEDSGPAIADYSGNANTGTYVGGVALQQAGATLDPDAAASLNGSTGYAIADSYPGFAPGQARTIAMFYKQDASQAGIRNLFTLFNGTTATAIPVLETIGTNTPRWYGSVLQQFPIFQDWTRAPGVDVRTDNAWHLIVFRHDDTIDGLDGISLWVDGANYGPPDSGPGATGPPTGNYHLDTGQTWQFLFGNRNKTVEFVDASYDEVAIWERWLSDAEVASLALAAGIRLTNNVIAALEADAAQGLLLSKAVALAPSSETNAAQALTFTKPIRVTPGAAQEADASQALAYVKPIFNPITTATETDAAIALALAKALAITPASSTAAAQALVLARSLGIAAATETDAAQALDHDKLLTLSPAAETDAAQVVVLYHPPHVDLVTASETDAAVGIAFTKPITRAITAASETDVAVALALARALGIAPGAESDAATGITFTKPLVKVLVPGAETDAAPTLSVSHSIYVTLPPSSEADAAPTLTFIHPIQAVLAAASETDFAPALVVVHLHFLTLAPASETDHALALSVLYSLLGLPGRAVVHDNPVGSGTLQNVGVGSALVTDE